MSKIKSKIGIVAGRGELPRLLIRACYAQGYDCFVLAFENQTEPETVIGVEHAWTRLGAIGKSLSLLRHHQVQTLVLAGGVTRPSWKELRPDFKGAEVLAKIGKLSFGDDGILSAIVSMLEKEGFQVIAAEDILEEALVGEGVQGEYHPSGEDKVDIQRGFEAAKALGGADIGQGVIVQQGLILAAEAVEGTDGMLSRCLEARSHISGLGKGGVLVKVAKPQQERRVDLPTIGIKTIERASQANLNGIALEANCCLVINKPEVIAYANALKLFVYGIKGGE